MLRTNQQKAIHASIANDFQSGVHFHATGTGKSWIALQLLLEFHQRHSNANVMWICEQKSILVEQFEKDTISSKGYTDTLKKFLILDYTTNKEQDWPSIVSSCQVWRKPILLIMNRAFLTSCKKYTQLRAPFHLIIHDECHSISNHTTQEFYKHILGKWPSIRCIGFSATPTFEYEPFTTTISSYTIYDGVVDKVILPPKMMWMKSDHRIMDEDVLHFVKSTITILPYQKLVVWCGMIETCQQMAKQWSMDPYFEGWMIAVDTSEEKDDDFATYDAFRKCRSKGLLFCAGKHREGSDIPFLDGCIFLDRVEDRTPKTFVQCMGRVLRDDPNHLKTFGLVLDITASSSIKLCDRMNKYLNESSSIFPFKYHYQKGDRYDVHTLDMIPTPNQSIIELPVVHHTPHELIPHFRRPFPTQKKYVDRLLMELELISSKKLNGYLLQAIDILKMTEGIPHVTRGSCGSSLVCYLLGISHVDPIRWNIHFARFLNEFRSTLPDIDFDFPHTLRDEVFLQIQMKWPGKVARISNHVYFHKKSALREAIRRVGIRKMIPSLEIHHVIKKLPKTQQTFVHSETKKLENTFRTYSLHCGGIVFYPTGIPTSLKLMSKRSPIMSQIILNKQDIAKEKHFKIDILSSRALTQLYEANGYRDISFESFLEDEATMQLFHRGDNIGITLAESPLIRKAFMKLRPKTVDDIATCLAIIRPAARDARVVESTKDLDAMFVYDDDAIDMIAKSIQCTYAEADQYRRGLTKGDASVIKKLKEACQAKKVKEKDLFQKLRNLRKYSFCKSHAYSYAQLVWQLGYMKANHPAEFWKSTLKHCQSSYRKWVHLYEAQLAGVTLHEEEMNQSIYAVARKRNKVGKDRTPMEQMYSMGYWTCTDQSFFPDCYLRLIEQDKVQIRGLIANSRILSYDKKIKRAVLYVGFDSKRYVEIIITGKQLFFTKKIGITCQSTCMETGVYQAQEKDIQFW